MSRARRREALKTLPTTLDEFYHRLLQDVHDDNMGILKKALYWLLLSARPLTVAELAEAVIISPTRPFLDPEERLDDEQCILTILPAGFVRIVSETIDYGNSERPSTEEQIDESQRNLRKSSPVIQLAHHSVKDYLLSSRVPKQELRIDYAFAQSVIERACVAYFIHVAQASSLFTQLPYGEFTLLDYVASYWPYHMLVVGGHDEVLFRYLTINLFRNSPRVSLIRGGTGDDDSYTLANELPFPCSRGSPCVQCTRLSLERQYALLSSSNNPTTFQPELLFQFLVPGKTLCLFRKFRAVIDIYRLSDESPHKSECRTVCKQQRNGLGIVRNAHPPDVGILETSRSQRRRA